MSIILLIVPYKILHSHIYRLVFVSRKAAPKALKRPPEIVKFFKSFGIQTKGREPRGFKADYIWGNNILKSEVIDYLGLKNHKMVVVEKDCDAHRY